MKFEEIFAIICIVISIIGLIVGIVIYISIKRQTGNLSRAEIKNKKSSLDDNQPKEPMKALDSRPRKTNTAEREPIILQRPYTGMLISGGILTFIGGIAFIIFNLLGLNLPFFTVFTFFQIIIIFILVAGIVLLVIGIVLTVKSLSHNSKIREAYQDTEWYGNCIYCHSPIHCEIQNFYPHSKYPEGFTHCPICKKPVSRNALHAVKKGSHEEEELNKQLERIKNVQGLYESKDNHQ